MIKQRILNVGCGKDTYGTDFLDLKPQRKKVIRCDIDQEKFPYKSKTFNVVYSRALLEHLRNPQYFFAECHRVLIKDGMFIVITDNAHFLGYHLRGTAHTGGYEKNAVGGSKDKHYALLTPNHLLNHLLESGFYNIEIGYDKDEIHSFIGFMIRMLSLFSRKHFSSRIIARCRR